MAENVKGNEIDLGLALGTANRGAVANANARSTLDTVVGQRPLGELVWSAQNALSIKSAGMKSCIFKDVGLTGGKNQRTADLLPLLVKDPEVLQTNAENIGLPLKMQVLVKEDESRYLEKIEETNEYDATVRDAAAIVGGEEDSWREEEGESVESCNSASKKNKRWRFEQQWIVGSKRIKKQSQECGGVVKQQDSSFMNWISNMVKGVKPYQEEGHPSTPDDHEKRLETKAQMESGNSKEIILFDDKTTDDNSLYQNAFGNLWITRLSPKTPSTTRMATHSEITCFICGKTGHESRDCLQINENTSVLSRKKVSHFNEIPMQIASTSETNMMREDKILNVPKEMFDTIRRLRLSRTDILKWMNSHLEISKLDGYFLRLRVSKGQKGVVEGGYYVARITDENPSKGSKKPIRVNIKGVQCLVECRYISNCDFLEDELITWWRTTFTSGQAVMEKQLTSKLEERKKLGF